MILHFYGKSFFIAQVWKSMLQLNLFSTVYRLRPTLSVPFCGKCCFDITLSNENIALRSLAYDVN